MLLAKKENQRERMVHLTLIQQSSEEGKVLAKKNKRGERMKETCLNYKKVKYVMKDQAKTYSLWLGFQI